jgi:hypothetical protein
MHLLKSKGILEITILISLKIVNFSYNNGDEGLKLKSHRKGLHK